MNTDDVRSVLADQATRVGATRPVPFDALHGRITTYRRRRTAATTGAVSLVVAGLVALSLQGAPTRGPDPAPDPTTPNPTPGRTVNADGSVTVIPDIGPGDALGWETLERRSTTDEGREDDPDLSVTANDQMLLTEVDFSCRGTADTWYVVSYLDGAGGYLPCLEDAKPVAYPPELVPNEEPDRPETLGEVTMYLTEPGQLNCWDSPTVTPANFDACVAGYEPLADVPAGVTAELVVWGHPDVPTVATVFKDDYGALGILDGTEYLLGRVDLSAPGATTLTLDLEPADTSRLVCVLRAPEAEVLLDGQRPPRSQRLTTTIEWGEPCVFVYPDVTTELMVESGASDGDRFAVVIWEARP